MKNKNITERITYLALIFSIGFMPGISGADLSLMSEVRQVTVLETETTGVFVVDPEVEAEVVETEVVVLPEVSPDSESLESGEVVSEALVSSSGFTAGEQELFQPEIVGHEQISEDLLPSKCSVADFNEDSIIDTRDILDFLNAWNEEDLSTDVDENGVIDEADFKLFLSIWMGCKDCLRADFNGDGTYNSLDILAFLNAYNAGEDSADFNDDGVINSDDFNYFLAIWQSCKEGSEFTIPDPGGGTKDGDIKGPVDGIEIDRDKIGGGDDDGGNGGGGGNDGGGSSGGGRSGDFNRGGGGGLVLGADSEDDLEGLREELRNLIEQMIALLQSELNKRLAMAESGTERAVFVEGVVLGESVEAQELEPVEEEQVEVVANENLEEVVEESEDEGSRSWLWLILILILAIIIFLVLKKKKQ
ncbi:MAG: GC-type dockerin domain-anchored protein [Candidatus Paceibacterota bacterium]|nr:MAG: GC-type dockerin domain-anchored protein [Candidatus Paceibacterota bacterium]